MPTSSAKPARLLQYRNGGLEQVEAWEPEVGNLRTALEELRSALSGLDLPDECQVSVLFHEVWFDSLTQNQRHLDEWVGDVANQFILADGGNPAQFDINANLNTEMSADDSEIVVGFADRYESEAQAREDAAALDEILGEAGLIHPYELANNPELLEELAQQYPELRDILERSARFATDESYAVELVNTLGPQNVRTMADLTNSFGLAQDRGLIEGDAYLGYVVPFAAILGNASRSGRMDRSVRDAVFDMDATDEPPIDGTNVDSIQSAQLEDMRYRSMALLLSAGDFTPRMTADMANAIIHDSPIHPEFYDYQGFTDPTFLRDHQALASDRYAAVVALQGDDAAANLFYSMDSDGNGEYENLYIMNTEGGTIGAELAAERLGLPVDEVAPRINEAVANSLRGGLLEHPLATGTTYSPETVTLVTEAIEAAGWEHMSASDESRVALAQISAPYTQDLAIIAAGGGDDLPGTRLPGIDLNEMEAFMEEVSVSEQGRVGLSQNAAALVRSHIDAEAGDIAGGDPTAFGVGERLATAYYGEMGEAWDNVQVGWVEQREALVAGWQSVTDPVVELVSGKIVERIPVVNTAANLPLVSNVVDGITGGIHDSINSAIYDNAIPKPELESMQTWRDAIGGEVNTAVAEGLYGNAETRQHYLDQAARDQPGLWAELNADGEVTLDEFRQIEGVQDSVNTYGGEILDGFQSRMAFNETFKE
jgi:hypothetical protein